jgi:hypothetical protein
MIDMSKLKLYSLGIVIEDKKDESDYIKANPTETISFSNDILTDDDKKYQTETANSKNVKSKDKLTGGSSLVAKWVPFGQSNRISAPDVVKGETVILFKYADDDDYYWTTIFREPSLRRLEHVLYAYSDLKDGNKAFDKNSSYWIEISTKKKHIHLHTSKSNEEPYGYDVKIDTARGKLTIDDNAGNSIFINSKEGIMDFKAVNKINFTTKEMNIKANVKMTNSVTSNGVNISNTHYHGNGDNGNPTTEVIG